MGRVYLEPVFAVNTLMNLLIFYIAGRISGQRPRLWRYLSASALGGLYAAVMLLPFAQALGNVAVKAALSLVMAALAWRIHGWLSFIKGWASYVGVTAVGGGGAYAAAALIDSFQPWSGAVRVGQNALVLTMLGAASLILFSSQAIRRRGGTPQRYTLRIWQGGRRYEIEALLDTGNMLREPLSGVPVVLLDRGFARRLPACEALPVEIPFGTAGGVSAVQATPAERVEVLCGRKWRNLGDLYLAACDGRLAAGVEALLPPAALE